MIPGAPGPWWSISSRGGQSVRVSKIEDGVLLLLGLVSGLKPALHLPFSFTLSLYPSGLDLSAGPGEPDPDFFLENGNLRFNPASRGPARGRIVDVVF